MNSLIHAINLHQSGHTAEAVEYYRKAITESPNSYIAHYNFAVALASLSRHKEAISHLNKTILLKPDFLDAYNNLGISLAALHRQGEAVDIYSKGLKHDPTHIKLLNNRGNSFLSLGRYKDAVEDFETAITKDPSIVETYNNLGNAFEKLYLYDNAIENFNKAIELNPNYLEAYFNLGNTYYVMAKYEDAIENYKLALKLNPEYTVAYNSMANAYEKLGKIKEAKECYLQAVKVTSETQHLSYDNLAILLMNEEKYDEAAEYLQKAISIKSDFAEAHFNMAMIHLLRGDFKHGFEEYEWRWKLEGYPMPKYTQPLWNGEDLTGKTLLLYAEQGYGDTIHFLRYLNKLDCTNVILVVPPALLKIANELKTNARIFSSEAEPPEFDVRCPLGSLPRILDTQLDTVPNQVPYCYVTETIVEKYKRILAKFTKFKVGIVWAGEPLHLHDKERSIPIEMLKPLFDIEGIDWFSLQVGPHQKELQVDHITDLSSYFTDFMETAGAISNLDLVISVDTAPVHLAGALGKPVWLLIPTSPDWRWLLDRSDSPWYPSMKIFRQEKSNDWGAPISKVKDLLVDRVKLNSSNKFIDLGANAIFAGRYDEGVNYCKKAIELSPNSADAYSNIGIALVKLGKFDDAIVYCKKALEINPNLFPAHNNLAMSLSALEKYDEAIAIYEQMLKSEQNQPEVMYNLGNIYEILGQSNRAIECYSSAIKNKKDFVQAEVNLATSTAFIGKYSEAIDMFRKIIKNNPECASAHWELATVLLKTGNYKEGFKEYEWRTKVMPEINRHTNKPTWNKSLENKTVLVHSDQGYGDTIQFLRYITLIKNNKVILELPNKLVSLARNTWKDMPIFAKNETLPDFDYQCSLESLPYIFGTTLSNIPDIPYLRVSSEHIMKFSKSSTNMKIGIAWAGREDKLTYRNRSISLQKLEPILKMPNIDWISLQIGSRVDDIQDDKIIDYSNKINDFSDTAGLMTTLDLVITTDTAVAHLAGALGIPVWILLHTKSDWRWLAQRNTSPWYPTAKLFRQKESGNWRSVVDDVYQDLVRHRNG